MRITYQRTIINWISIIVRVQTNDLYVGESVTGTGIAAGTTIASIDSSSQIHLSANATATGSPTLTFKFMLGRSVVQPRPGTIPS